MGKASVAIIPVIDKEHLRWIIETHTVVYKQQVTQELSLFDNDDFIFAENSVSYSILVCRKDSVLRYLACVKVREGSEPIPATDEDLDLLSYPYAKQSFTKYRLIDVDTSKILKPALDIDDEKLFGFLNERYITDVCSIHTIEELKSNGVIGGIEQNELPDESYDIVNGMLQTLKEEQRKRAVKEDALKDNYGNIRASKERLRITFADGTVLCDKSTATTFAQAIEKIGVENVAALGLEYCKTPLLSKEYSKNKNYKIAQREVSGGWLLFTQGSTATKLLILNNISNRLNLGLKVEKGADLQPVTKEKTACKKVVKNSLLVTLDDGTFIAGVNSSDTYVKTLRHIGLDKVRRLSADIMGVPLITTMPVAKVVQSDEHNGLYITIPNGTKRMYKYLMLIASFTHTKLTVTII